MFLLFISFCVSSYAVPYTPDDFNFQATLSEGKTSLRQLTLPVSVYQHMQRRDMGDLRVFSADGQLVPFQLMPLQESIRNNKRNLAFYPFSQKHSATPANIRVVINQKQGTQHVDINQQNQNITPKIEDEFQYIIENNPPVGNQKENNAQNILCGLELDWQQSKPSLILPFKLETSNNLQNWSILASRLNVSSLNYGDSQLIRKHVEFSCTDDQYLRLTWLKPEQEVRLKNITGYFVQGQQQQFQWVDFANPLYDLDGDWLFESGVVAPITRMEFKAPQLGLLYKGKLFSRNNLELPWRFRENVTQYHLNIGGADLESEPFILSANNDRYWKFESASEGLLKQDQLPGIRAGWELQQLVFLAQGNPPYKIAFGNPNVKPYAVNSLSALIQTFTSTGAMPDKVEAGNAVKIHDITTEPPVSAFPWKKVGLWFVLLLGTAFLAFMALSLFRQMDKK